MKIERIYSKNAAYQKFEVLKTNRNKRYKYRQFFVEGVRNLNEAVKNGWHICSFLYTREKKLSDWAENMLKNVPTEVNFELTAALMEDLSGKEDTSELMAVVQMREDSFDEIALSALQPGQPGDHPALLRRFRGRGPDPHRPWGGPLRPGRYRVLHGLFL